MWSLTHWLFYTIIGLLTAILYFLRKNLIYFKERGIPHDPPNWLYGNLRGFLKTHIFQDLLEPIYRRHKGTGPFCGLYIFQRPSILVLDTELAKNVLIKDFSNFVNRGFFYNERDDPLTGNLVALDGNKWKQLRQKLSPTFTSGKMKFMFPTVVKVAEEFVQVLSVLLKKGNVVDVKEMCARFTTDVIGTCAFGIECNSLKDPNAEFRVMGRKALVENAHGSFILGLMVSFPETARKLRMRSSHKDIEQFFMRIVRETVNYREQHKIKRNDFMDLLVELKNTKSMQLDNGEVLTGLTVEEVAAQAFIFFMAGFETSATTMSFALYELAQHQNVQDKLRAEINDVLAKHNHKFTYEAIKEMQYMKQVIYETSRLYTVVASLLRKSIDRYVVPGYPNYVIEKGMQIWIPSAAFHHDAEIYPEPDAFKPERFTPEMIANRDSVEWLAFGDGPRNCIGMRFGKMQISVGLAFLLKHFKFSVCKETQIPMQFDPTNKLLSAKGGIYLKVEKL